MSTRTSGALFISPLVAGLLAMAGLFAAMPAHADTIGPFDFESPSYSVGSVQGQNGWGGVGTVVNPSYDQGVVDNTTFGYSGLGSQSLRMSNAVVSGSFGDWVYSPSLANEAGESTAVNSGLSGGTRQNHFEAEFTIAVATSSGAYQPGAALYVSPDRGDGARMSYLRFEDRSDGIHVFFDDYSSGTFNETDITSAAPLSRTATHTVKFSIDFYDGAGNDVVNIYLDGALAHTGTTWEDYFRDNEPAIAPPTTDSLLFQERGTIPAAPDTLGEGFLIDNVTLSSSDNALSVTSGSLSDLQTALNSAPVGGLVYVTGSYTGDLTISHAVTLMASSSASLAGQINVNSDDVTVSGLDITNPNAGYGVVINGHSHVSVTNNTIHDIGTALTQGTAQAVYLVGGSSALTGDSVTGNTITNVGSVNLAYDGSSGSAKGIFVGDSTGTGSITGLTISNNTISNVAASTTPWTSSPVTKYGRGAYGILINFGASGGGTSSSTISGNTISNLSGLWAHAIGLEGNTPHTTLTGNTVSNLSDNKGGTDAVAVKLEDNTGIATTLIGSGNTLNGTSFTNNASSVAVDATLVGSATDAEVMAGGEWRYYGLNAFSTIGSAITGVSTGGTVSVAAGTYAESVSIAKALTLQGAQAGVAAADTTTGSVRTGSETSLTSASISASDVTIDGFTFTNTTGTQVSALPSSGVLSGIVIENNIFSGFKDVGLATNNAGNLSVTRNYFGTPTGSGEAIQIKNLGAGDGGCTGSSVTDNVFAGSVNNGGADVNFSCDNGGSSNSSGITVSGNRESGSSGGSSFTAFAGVSSGITIADNMVYGTADSGSTIYFFGGISGSVSITGNSLTGSTGSSAVSIQALIGGANSGAFSISGNTLSGNGRALKVGGDGASDITTGAQVSLNDNDISGSTIAAVADNSSSGIAVDATENFWGTGVTPTVGTDILGAGDGNVSFSPWFTDSARTSLKYPVTTTGSEASTTVDSDTTLSGDSSQGGTVSVQADIPASTVVTGDASWDGTLSAPVASTTNLTFSGLTTTVGAAVTVGSSNSDLLFSQPVKLTFAGQASKKAGWYDHAGVFTEISDSCDSATVAKVGGVDLATTSPGASCKADSGADLVVWTTHFSTFVTFVTAPAAPVISPAAGSYAGQVTISMDDTASGSAIRYTTDGSAPICNGNGNSYTNGQRITFITTTTVKAIRCQGTTASSQTSATYTITDATGGSGNSGSGSNGPVASSGGGGGGGGSPSFGTPAGSTGGQVLGAEAFQFTANLTVGAKGQDVIELQNILIAEGDLAAGLNTGLFGPLTKAAVIKYQKAHGISPASGYVGPLTRAELNKGSQATTPTTTGSVKQTLSDAQVSAILGLLSSFGADQATITNVAHALGK